MRSAGRRIGKRQDDDRADDRRAAPDRRGRITLGGEELAGAARVRSREQRHRVQIIFQNPSDALNPRHEARSIVARAARTLRGLSTRGPEYANQLLDLVRLPRGTGTGIPPSYPGVNASESGSPERWRPSRS